MSSFYAVCLRAASAAVIISSLLATTVRAEDQPFLTLDATDIEPQLGHELEQNFGWNHGLTRKAFNEFEGETELEYGFSDRIKLAVATSYSWAKEHDHSLLPSPYESGTAWSGITGEMIWQAMNVYFDPVGLGVLVAPAVGPSARGVEAKLLLQKNFLNDRLRFVINGGGAFGSEKEDGAWSDVSALTFDAGLAYNITWSWSLGVEFNAEHDFDGLLVNGKAVPVATTYYVGPTLQYIAHPWTASVGFQAQLPWANDPAHTSVYQGYLADAERFRIALRVTRDFY